MLPYLASAAGAYALLCLAAYLFQARLVYFPGEPPRVDPQSAGLEFEEHHPLTSDGLRLHAWWIPATDARGAVIVSHGNAGNIADRLQLARAFGEIGLSVLLYDYRGYGSSEGRPSERGLYLDALAAWELVVNELGVAPDSLVIYGESLGGAVAVELAGERPAAALVIESSFRSLPDVGAEAYPFLPVRWLARDRFESIDKVGELELPILIVHSPDDQLVRFSHAEALLAEAGTNAQLVRTHGDHNAGGFATDSQAFEQVRSFLQTLLADTADREQ